jgi:hypothetical protein
MMTMSPCLRVMVRTAGFSFLSLIFGSSSNPGMWVLCLGRNFMTAFAPRERVATVGPRVFSPSS